ncbi:hypothetical protein U9M48_034382 [Paspalum notatum var. saurae]|uniref:Uncharacterized protein n=1 Tax=Paspalum notatum var. saurae TaxID=547442 RepID=A0AAQ3X712_PASNO
MVVVWKTKGCSTPFHPESRPFAGRPASSLLLLLLLLFGFITSKSIRSD